MWVVVRVWPSLSKIGKFSGFYKSWLLLLLLGEIFIARLSLSFCLQFLSNVTFQQQVVFQLNCPILCFKHWTVETEKLLWTARLTPRNFLQLAGRSWTRAKTDCNCWDNEWCWLHEANSASLYNVSVYILWISVGPCALDDTFLSLQTLWMYEGIKWILRKLHHITFESRFGTQQLLHAATE